MTVIARLFCAQQSFMLTDFTNWVLSQSKHENRPWYLFAYITIVDLKIHF